MAAKFGFFYNAFWLTDVNKFPETVTNFKKISTNF